MFEELVVRCHANAQNGISPKDIALREAANAIETLEAMIFDGDGVNLVDYWQQQCQIAENGLRNTLNELERMKSIMRDHGIITIPSVIPGGKSTWNIPYPNGGKDG